MNGVHDLGGIDGFGPVIIEADEPVFHASWERVVFGLAATVRLQRLSNGDAFRHAIERVDPVHYLSSPYCEHWLTGMASPGRALRTVHLHAAFRRSRSLGRRRHEVEIARAAVRDDAS